MSTSSAGSIRVEIQNDQGEPFEGYSLEDCDEIIGDRLRELFPGENRQTYLPWLANRFGFGFC